MRPGDIRHPAVAKTDAVGALAQPSCYCMPLATGVQADKRVTLPSQSSVFRSEAGGMHELIHPGQRLEHMSERIAGDDAELLVRPPLLQLIQRGKHHELRAEEG